MSMRTLRLALFPLIFACATALASAHHFKGLPHFSYFENYPQVPQKEYLGQIGHFETSLMIYDFQGISKLDAEQPEDVRMYLVLFDLLKNETYNGPLTLRVMNGDVAIAEKVFPSSEEESLYAFTRTLPMDGDFSLEVALRDGSGLTDRLPFLLSHQVGDATQVVLISAGVLALIAGWGSRRMRILQDRRENAQPSRAI